ncbi:hypothetical protein [Tannerella sp.]|uniref:hypothetical protein n=1 Tax=Tannerella sp. TaxID=2382127 RepID=UPI003FA27D66
MIELRLAFSPLPEALFSPTLRFATHWAELLRPFRAVTAVSQQSKQLNNSMPEGLAINHDFVATVCI